MLSLNSCWGSGAQNIYRYHWTRWHARHSAPETFSQRCFKAGSRLRRRVDIKAAGLAFVVGRPYRPGWITQHDIGEPLNITASTVSDGRPGVPENPDPRGRRGEGRHPGVGEGVVHMCASFGQPCFKGLGQNINVNLIC